MPQRSISSNRLKVGNKVGDDQELAKVLSGITDQVNDLNSGIETSQETPNLPPLPDPVTPAPALDPVAVAPEMAPVEPFTQPAPAVESIAPVAPELPTTPVIADSTLDGIKKDAIQELRPLVDKLDLQPEEKFDTYLLILRSTDDKDLVAPAHEAAKAITDETKRAQALLDIIKEVDYLSGQQTNV